MMSETYKAHCNECGAVTPHRYLDCEECRIAHKECIDICCECGTERGTEE